MVILMVAETLLLGGAEWFLLRQYVYLKEKGFQVHLFVTRPDHIDQRILEQFPDLVYTANSVKLTRLSVFVDRVLTKLVNRPFFVDFINIRRLKKEIRTIKPDVIHSHLLEADYKVMMANRTGNIRHVITIHGDYIGHIKEREEFFIKRLDKVLAAVSSVVVITREQQDIISAQAPAIKSKIVKIYNGYLLKELPEPKPVSNTFTFGLIARGIPEKGWEQAIQAFLQ